MRLAEYTDYTLRVLMFCAANPDRLVTVAEIAEAHGISRNHLMKIVSDLARQGVLETVRGRRGGFRLLKMPSEVRVGDVVRSAETDFRLVECFDAGTNACSLSQACRMKHLMGAALEAFFQVLDGASVADIVGPPASPLRQGAGVVIPIQPGPSAPRQRSRRHAAG